MLFFILIIFSLGDKKGAKVAKLTKNEVLMVNIGSLSTGILQSNDQVFKTS